MTTCIPTASPARPTGNERLALRWRDPSPVVLLLFGGGAMITAAVMAWAVLEGAGLITPMSFTVLGVLACAGTAALHAAAAVAAIGEMARP